MGVVRNTVSGVNLLTALGGTVAAGDDVIISEGNEIYNAGLTLDTNEANSFVVTRTFGGSLGVAGTPVEIDLAGAGDYLHYEGQGMAWIKADGVGTTIAKATIRDTGPGIFHCSGGTWTVLTVGGGHVEVQSSSVVTGATVGKCREFNAAAHATAFTTLYMDGCLSSLIERGATTSEFRNCNVHFDNRSYSVGTCTLGEGAYLRYNGTTITKLIGKPGGTLDLTWQTQALTITNADLYRGFRIINPSNLPITWSNEPVAYMGGPEWFVQFTG